MNSTQPSSELSQSLVSDEKNEEEHANLSQTSTHILISPVQVQLNGSVVPGDTPSDGSKGVSISSSASLSPNPPNITPSSSTDSVGLQPSSQCSTLATDLTGPKLTPDRESLTDTKPPSPVPDGYQTPTFPLVPYYYPLLNVPHVPYTGYTAITIPAIQPPLPEKKRHSSTPGSLNGHNSVLRASSVPSPTHQVYLGEQRRGSVQSACREEADIRVNAKFVQDSSKYWYKPGISRDQGEG